MGAIKEMSGYTIKEEQVSTLRHNILHKTFVIDVNHPFPGFYGSEMHDPKHPRSLIFITQYKYPWEKILRATEKINEFIDTPIIGGACEVYLWNTTFHGIRIKGIQSYDLIPTIQHAYKEEGFEFMKKKKMEDNTTILMKVKKFFIVEELDEGIFSDKEMPEMSYILIPKHLNWELFRKITMKIKNNVSNRSYDVVEGVFYTEEKIKDMLRIYKPNIELGLLKEIKTKYLEEIKAFD